MYQKTEMTGRSSDDVLSEKGVPVWNGLPKDAVRTAVLRPVQALTRRVLIGLSWLNAGPFIGDSSILVEEYGSEWIISQRFCVSGGQIHVSRMITGQEKPVGTLFQRHIASQLIEVFSRKIVRHLTFWLMFLCFLVMLDEKEYGLIYAIAKHMINILFYSLVVYFNLYYLIPNYLTQKTFLTYVGLLILSVMILTPVKALVFYLMFAGSPVHREYVTFNQQFIFVLMFSVAAASTVAKIVNDWLQHQRDRKELETRNMQSELKFLKSQINPHFLFNTLNSIYALTLKKSDKAPEIVIKLSDMMRYMLYECNERQVPLHKEVQYIRNYVDLEMLRQGQKVRIDFQVKGEIRDQMIAPLIFTPFLENSFKHGVNQISEGFVDILLVVEDKNVILHIENSKPMHQQVLNHKKPTGGIGLANVRRRLDLLYPESYVLDIKDLPDRYKVNLNLALNPVEIELSDNSQN